MVISKKLAGTLLPFEIATSDSLLRTRVDSFSKLPVRCNPLRDELFSSWLVRTAWLNAEKLHTFGRRFWAYPGSPWGRNIDLTFADDALDEVARISSVDRETLAAHMLCSYGGSLFQHVDKNGTADGILVGRNRGQKTNGFGLQLCQECMQTDSTPYFRRWWKVAYMVCCPIHKQKLIDACPNCQEPLAYHKSDCGKILLSELIPTAFCARCGYRWSSEGKKVDNVLTDEFVEWQGQVFEALETGWMQTASIGSLYALSFFQGLRTLIRLVATDGHCKSLRMVISKELGLLPLGSACFGNQNQFSGARLGDRLSILRYVFWMLQEWPDRFIWSIKAAGIAYSYVDTYRNSTPLAYWIASVADYARDPRHARISAKERESVKEYLEIHQLRLSANQINRWLGRWYVH